MGLHIIAAFRSLLTNMCWILIRSGDDGGGIGVCFLRLTSTNVLSWIDEEKWM